MEGREGGGGEVGEREMEGNGGKGGREGRREETTLSTHLHCTLYISLLGRMRILSEPLRMVPWGGR